MAVVRQTQPQVVQIQTDSGLGSGVIFDAKGHIVTNAHVVGAATQLLVTLADGRRFDARLVGSYVPDDLAVVDIGAGHGITPARFADSSKLAVGEIVLAEGNPLGLQSSVTDGIISALGRNVSEGQGVVLPSAIQTSAPINPGNSGGALDRRPRAGGRHPDPRGGQPRDRRRRRRHRLCDPQQYRLRHRRPDHPPRPGRELASSRHRRIDRQR